MLGIRRKVYSLSPKRSQANPNRGQIGPNPGKDVWIRTSRGGLTLQGGQNVDEVVDDGVGGELVRTGRPPDGVPEARSTASSVRMSIYARTSVGTSGHPPAMTFNPLSAQARGARVLSPARAKHLVIYLRPFRCRATPRRSRHGGHQARHDPNHG